MANQRICSVEDCDKLVAKSDFCVAHYQRLLRHGSPVGGAPQRSKQPSICTVENCTKVPHAHGLCAAHYRRLREYGDPLGAAPQRNQNPFCKIDGCDGVNYKKGLCSSHYRRLLRHGNPYSGRTRVGDSLLFIERSLSYTEDDCLIWPYGKSSAGYAIVWLNGIKQQASRVVCERIYGPPPTSKHEAAHTCGNGHKGCIAPSHLRWATSVENKADMLIHGTRVRGSRHCNAKLCEEDVLFIRKQLKSGVTQADISRLFCVSESTIRQIKMRRNWSWLKG